MKNILTVFAVLCALSLTAQNQSITLVSNIWPPFTDLEGKQSISNKVVQTALERIGVNSTVHFESFNKVVADVKNNTYNGSAALWFKRERQEYMLFSDAYLQNQLMLVSLKGNKVDEVSLADLENKKVGLAKDFAYSDSIINHPNIHFQYSQTDQRNVEKLFMGEIDYLLVDNLVLNHMLTYDLANVKDTIAISEHPYSTKSMHFALNKNVPNASQIIEQFNAELDKMILDGTLHTILGMQWIQADINNDGVPELILNGNQAGTDAPASAYQLFHDSNATAQQKGYYINGQYYLTWSDVPKDYKTTPKNQPAPESYNPGIRINF